MKKASAFSVLALMLLLFTSCRKDELALFEPAEADVEAIIADAPVDPCLIAKELLDRSGWPREEALEVEARVLASSPFLNYRREVIAGNIVHYAFQVQMGPDPNDRIGIHRVVREVRPFQPVKTPRAFFFQHGDAKDFEGMMLPGTKSATTSDDFGLAVFLARHDVDVWGIDQAWTLTPPEVTDHAFMAGWGIQKQVTDLRQAMAVARVSRFLTGNGAGRLILAGYSSGVVTGYALLNEETGQPPELRHAGGFIALDLAIKTDDPALKGFFQAFHDQVKSLYDGGQYAEFIPFKPLGNLARTDPDGDSPIFPGFTNLQAAMYYGAGPIFEVIPFHYLAGVWENDLPAGLQHLTREQWYDFLESAPPYEALLFEIEYAALIAELGDLPFDDHFADIRVPILNLSPAGGFGELSKYGTILLGSPDITHVIPQLRPAEEALLDFGHIDLFIAGNAEGLVWRPILEWVNAHSGAPGYRQERVRAGATAGR